MTVARDFEEFFASCNKHGAQYLVVGGEDLIANKRASGRKQDLADLEDLT